MSFRYGVRASVFNAIGALAVAAAVFSGIASAAAQPLRIIAFGDSLTAGLGLSERDAFPAKLEVALKGAGIAARVTNAGVSGDTTAGGLARLDFVVPDETDLVILELGSNDGLRGFDPKVTFANLDSILTRLDARGIDALLAGMLAPPNLGPAYGAAFNPVFPRLAEKHGAVFFPFFLQGVAAVRALNQADGIHPNATGVDIIVANILPFVIKALQRAGG